MATKIQTPISIFWRLQSFACSVASPRTSIGKALLFGCMLRLIGYLEHPIWHLLIRYSCLDLGLAVSDGRPGGGCMHGQFRLSHTVYKARACLLTLFTDVQSLIRPRNYTVSKWDYLPFEYHPAMHIYQSYLGPTCLPRPQVYQAAVMLCLL